VVTEAATAPVVVVVVLPQPAVFQPGGLVLQVQLTEHQLHTLLADVAVLAVAVVLAQQTLATAAKGLTVKKLVAAVAAA
jgi:hypothetical protein